MTTSTLDDNPQQGELLRVCRIGRAQGLKGEVTVQIYTDEPELRFEPGAELFTRNAEQMFVVERSRTFKNRWIVKFEGIDDRNAAEALNGTTLYGEEWELDDDEFYPKDIVGLEVRLPDGRSIGKVVDMFDNGQWLIKIRLTDGNETALVPFVEALVPEIDLEQQYLIVDPPGGLIPGID